MILDITDPIDTMHKDAGVSIESAASDRSDRQL